MVIWLRNPQAEGAEAGHGVGLESDVLTREELARVIDLDAAYSEMHKQCEAALQAAQAQAQALIDDAQARAGELLAHAQAEYTSAAHRGYDEGFQQGLADWHERALQAQYDAQTIGRRQHQRLAELVALAVEEIVGHQDPVALFTRAAATVERLVADGSPVHVCVHPSDFEAASAAFDKVVLGWRDAGRSVRLQLRADAALDVGACVCETDLGVVDASLSVQLAAMRGALARALQSMPESELAGVDEGADANGIDVDGQSACDEPAGNEPDGQACYDETSDAEHLQFEYSEEEPAS